MDLVVSGGEDQLLESLRFDLPKQASFVQSRSLKSWYPSGASQFSPSAVKVARFHLGSGDGSWLDPATLRVRFKVVNTSSSQVLKLCSGPHCLFERLRILASGTQIEDISMYNRMHELFRKLLMGPDWVINEAVESGMQVSPASLYDPVTPMEIPPGGYATLNLTPLCALLSAGRHLPLQFCPLTIELTLGDVAAALAPGTTGSYEIEAMSIRASTILLDSALQSSYAQMMLQNRALVIPLRCLHVQQQAVPANQSELQIQSIRAFSRLNAIFYTFLNRETGSNPDYTHQTVSFVNPSAKTNTFVDANSYEEFTLEWILQHGSKLIPEAPSSSLAESFSVLREAVGIVDESIRVLNISPNTYKLQKFCIGVPMMKVPGVFSSGTNSRSGDITTLTVKNLDPNSAGGVGRVITCYVAESLLEVRSSGVSLMD